MASGRTIGLLLVVCALAASVTFVLYPRLMASYRGVDYADADQTLPHPYGQLPAAPAAPAGGWMPSPTAPARVSDGTPAPPAGALPEFPTVRHKDVPMPQLTPAQLDERDSDLIIHAATGEARRILRSSEVALQAAEQCSCPRPFQHPTMIGVQCPKGCSGHGKCDRGCVCDRGWGGFGCWTQLDQTQQSGGLSLLVTPKRGRAGCAARVFANIKQWAPKARVVAVVEEGDTEAQGLAASFGNLATVVKVADAAPLGARLRAGMQQVPTPYVLVLGEEGTISPYTDLRAVMWNLHNTDFLMVGGLMEMEQPGRRWLIDHRCHQLHVRNYTMSQVWGYQASQQSCLSCSSISEVFATEVARFQQFGGFDPWLDGEAVMADLWIRARGVGTGITGEPREPLGNCLALQFERTRVCLADPLEPYLQHVYKPLGRKHSIVEFDMGHHRIDPIRACPADGGAENVGDNGLATNPCALEDMENAVWAVAGAIVQSGAAYALAGQLYEGALKYQALVPWANEMEMDAWGTAEQLHNFHASQLDGLRAKTGVTGRLDRVSEDGHTAYYAMHTPSGRVVWVSFSLLDEGGDPVSLAPYSDAVLPLTAAERTALPQTLAEVGPDNRVSLPVHGGKVTAPTALVRFGRGAAMVRKSGRAYTLARMGGDRWAANDVSPLGAPTTCGPGERLTSGCMEGWAWHADWENYLEQGLAKP